VDEDWVIPAAMFVGVQYAIALSLSVALGFPHIPPLLGYVTIGAMVTVCGGVWLLLRTLWRLYRSGIDHPAREIAALIASHQRRLAIAILGIQLVVLQMGSLTWLKTLMPLVVPFWADAYLANLDAVIFGTDPWRLLTPALDPIGPFIDAVYAAWFPIKSFVVAALLISLPSFSKSRAALAYFYTVGIFGVLGQYAFSSAGPLFYEMAGFGDRFADLEGHLTPAVKATRAYLWQSYVTGGDRIGTGISAMPSIHVALATWVALTLRCASPRAAILGWAFLITILVGSVYLGWHYAVDGIAGVAAAAVSWALADWTIRAMRSRWSGQARKALTL
jgi:hypothetical protein